MGSWTGKLNIVQMAILAKVTHRFDVSTDGFDYIYRCNQNSNSLFAEMES